MAVQIICQPVRIGRALGMAHLREGCDQPGLNPLGAGGALYPLLLQ